MFDTPNEQLVGDVTRLVIQVQTDLASQAVVDLRPSTNITILGGRGSGKSTLLAASAAALPHSSRIVLPTIDPEMLHPGDSLMTWVLTGLDQQVSSEVLDTEISPGWTIRKQLHDLRRSHLIVSADMPRSLVGRGVNPLEYARDTSELTPLGMRINQSWNALLDKVAEVVDEPQLIVVLPIDDVDLHPARLADILRQLVTLGSSARFQCIMAADESNLLTNMALGDPRDAQHWDTAIKYGFALRNDLGEFSARQYAKHFPRPYRVRLSDVPSEHRLDYTPVQAESESLGELLASFEFSYSGLSNLRDLFQVRMRDGERAPNYYTRAISGNRRDLQQLCAALAALKAVRAPAGEALAEVIEHSLEACRTTLPAGLRDAVAVARTSRGAELELNTSGIRFGTTIGRGLHLFMPDTPEVPGAPKSRVSARRMTDFYTTPRNVAEENVDPPQPRERTQRPVDTLPEMFSTLVYLAWEAKEIQDVSRTPLLPLARLSGTVVTPGLRNWTRTLSTATAERTAAPDPIANLMVPDWEEFSDYFSYIYAWSHLIDHFETKTRHLRPVHASALVELAILVHLHSVVDIQESKSLGSLELTEHGAEVIGAGGDWDAVYAEAIAGLESRIPPLVARAKEAGAVERDVDFVTWAGLGLIVTSSRNIATERLSEDLRRLWLSLELDTRLRATASEYLGTRIPEFLREDRAAADIELLEFISPERGRTLATVREAFSERIESARRNTLTALRAGKIDQPTLERLEREGASHDTLAALGAQGVSGQDLSRVAELFPVESQDPPTAIENMND